MYIFKALKSDKKKTRTILIVFATLVIVFLGRNINYQEEEKINPDQTYYLFAYFTWSGKDGIHFALSDDGIKWTALNKGNPIIKPLVGDSLTMRDPSIVQGPDGVYHMVWTAAKRSIGYSHSTDLIKWSDQILIPVMEHETLCQNTWAPEIFYDNKSKEFMIYWASTIEDKFLETASTSEDDFNHRIYYVTTKDFANFSDTQLLFNPGFSIIDSFIVTNGNQYIQFFKDETRYPNAHKNLLLATSSNLTGPYTIQGESFTKKWIEGPSVLKIGEYWYLYYDEYTILSYGAIRTKDLKIWEPVKIQYPFGMRHGTAIPVSGYAIQNFLNIEDGK